jgi:outer membrane protein assembly factor BamE
MGVYISRIIVYITFIVLFVVSQPGCLKIYRQDLRQGNYVTQERINKLKVGQSKEEVQKIMGSPALVPVIDINRWDYYYSFMSGNRKVIEKKSLSLYFVNNKLKSFDGDWVPAHLPHK